MVDIKLARLPDRTPVKLAIAVTPQLHADLLVYAELYREAYGVEESPADLVPSIVAAFLAADRAFVSKRANKT